MRREVKIKFVNEKYYLLNVALKSKEELENEIKEEDEFLDFAFREYELKFTRENDDELQVEIKTPKELEGLSFHVYKKEDLTKFISEKVSDPFKYMETNEFNILDENIKNNIIINIAHIDYLNEEFKKDEANGKYINKYNFIEQRIKNWFLEIDDLDMIFEREVEELNKISDIPNKKDELKSQELIMMYNKMQNTLLYYDEIKKKYFSNKKECLNNNYVKLLKKSVYNIEVDGEEYRLLPINLNDRFAEFEIISPFEYKGLIILLRHIPVFILSLTRIRPYFDSGRLTRYGYSELELIIKDKNFYDSGRNINNLLNVTNDKSSDFSRFKSLYKKVFETNNKFKLETHDEKDDKYLLIINEFYNKYADLVSREYSNILQNDLRTPFPISYNSSDKKVYDAKELSIQYMDSFFDKFRHFFIKKLVKKYSPLNNLPIPKGSLTIGKHKITTS